jgi:DNA repair exonuclease SbcCD ATPase subunit
VVIFKKIRWKNFLSTGNEFTGIDLINAGRKSLISGKNGNGKSTVIDALTFCLFGKPYRNINKPQLVNSINQKNCVTEIEFSAIGSDFKVVRGIKPHIFEIWRDGKLVDQQAALKDYQSILETQILKMNYKTFTQVVVIGSASYVPFMELKAYARREVVEELLDIGIFSSMATLNKERLQKLKTRLSDIEANIKLAQNKVEAQKKVIAAIKDSQNKRFEELSTKKDSLKSRKAARVSKRAEAELALKEIIFDESEQKRVKAELQKLQERFAVVKNNLSRLVNNTKKIQSMNHCDTCHQEVGEDHKKFIMENNKSEAVTFSGEMESLKGEIEGHKSLEESLSEQRDKVNSLMSEIRDQSYVIGTLEAELKQVEVSLNQESIPETKLVEEQTLLKEIASKALAEIEEKKGLLVEAELLETSAKLLKDDGIKAAIIKEYIPVMNKLINGYLEQMDSYIKFELDEEFNEYIRSRGRDEFSYASFSEGEKTRINLAIVFTWRAIARMKNSASCNLLMLDEIADSSADSEGMNAFFDILDSFPAEVRSFTVSHRENIADKFDSVLNFVKVGDFSILKS